MSLETQCIVIGAGVVGLAVARALQLSGYETFLIDRETSFGTHTSSRNSEVIHAGIYYEPGSLKAQHCVRGKHLLYQYCRERSLPHYQIGKIIVAVTDEEETTLEKYYASATANGVNDLTHIDRADIFRLEPAVVGRSGLMSPSTGIIDSHQYMLSLLGDFEDAGGHFVRRSTFQSSRIEPGRFELKLSDGVDVSARWVINSAGLYAPNVAAAIEGFPKNMLPTAHYAIGHYFALMGKSPFKRLVYPIARAGGLGVHVTLDMQQRARFGPDIAWISDIDYSFDETRHAKFVDAIRSYYPALEPEKMVPGYTGIRPKLCGPGSPDMDFVIQSSAAHGIPGLINLFGIESPGLTSSLSIASTVAGMVNEHHASPNSPSEPLSI